jgi:hypothetical protein
MANTPERTCAIAAGMCVAVEDDGVVEDEDDRNQTCSRYACKSSVRWKAR